MGLLARFLAGLAVAAMCTPAGISGAFLLLPVQVHLFHVPQPAVSATNLVYNLVSTPAGAATYRRRGRLDLRLAGLLCAGTIPGVVAGALIRSTWLADPARFGWLAAAVLVVLGVRLLTGPTGAAPATPETTSPPAPLRLAVVGTVAGVIGGVYGLGGASLLIPWLVAVERMPFDRVAGAGLVTTFATSVVGITTFAVASGTGFGEAAAPDWSAGVALGLGGLVGAVIGARIQPRVPVRALRIGVAVASFAAAVRMAT